MKKTFLILALLGFSGLSFATTTETSKADANATKESYLNKADREVQEWTAKLKSLQERSESSGAKTRDELDRRIKVVDENLATARKKLDDLHASSSSAWTTLRNGLEDTLGKVKRDYQTAVSFFNKSKTSWSLKK